MFALEPTQRGLQAMQAPSLCGDQELVPTMNAGR
jgi:hypothetical protein